MSIGAFRRALEAQVETRVDLESAVIDASPAVSSHELQSHVLEEVRRLSLGRSRTENAQRGGGGFLETRGGEASALAHRGQHAVAAPESGFRTPDGREGGRIRREAGEQSGFGDREIDDVLAEVAMRRRLHAICPFAEIDPVQVELENFVLRKRTFEPDGEDDLFQLALDRPALIEEEIARELLRDRARSLRHSSRAHIAHEGSEHGDDVDAPMPVEAAVFGGENRIRHVFRDSPRGGRES